jgi:hypothetical protein
MDRISPEHYTGRHSAQMPVQKSGLCLKRFLRLRQVEGIPVSVLHGIEDHQPRVYIRPQKRAMKVHRAFCSSAFSCVVAVTAARSAKARCCSGSLGSCGSNYSAKFAQGTTVTLNPDVLLAATPTG